MKIKQLLFGILFTSGILLSSVVGCAGGNEINQSSQSTPESSQPDSSQPDSSSVAEEKNNGVLIDLEKAYEMGIVSRHDLLCIAYNAGGITNPYHYMTAEGVFEDKFTPMPAGELDSETSLKIKEDIAHKYRTREDNPIAEAKAEDFELDYYGCYNGYYVFQHNRPYTLVISNPSYEATTEIKGFRVDHVFLIGVKPYLIWKESDDNSIFYKPASYNGLITDGNRILKIIDSHEKLTHMFSEMSISWHGDPIWVTYSKEFFDSKSMIFYCDWVSGSNVSRVLENVRIEGEKIILQINESSKSNAINDAVFVFSVLLEVDKDDIVGIKNVEVDFQFCLK